MKIPYEVADAITLTTLKVQRKILKKELKRWKENPRSDENPDGYWMHPEDVGKNVRMIGTLTEVIKYFGGE
jgi:hypothetical protein